METTLAIGGGLAGLLTFVFGMFRVVMTDRRWETLTASVQAELEACRKSEARLHERLDALGGEITALRDRLHRLGWTEEP